MGKAAWSHRWKWKEKTEMEIIDYVSGAVHDNSNTRSFSLPMVGEQNRGLAQYHGQHTGYRKLRQVVRK